MVIFFRVPLFKMKPNDGTSFSTTCSVFLAEEPALLASVQNEVLFIHLRSSNMQMLLPSGQKPIFTLDYDWREQRVFWVCLQEESIKYAVHGDKGSIKTLVKGWNLMCFLQGVVCQKCMHKWAGALNIAAKCLSQISYF